MAIYAESNGTDTNYAISFEAGEDDGAYLIMTVTDDENGGIEYVDPSFSLAAAEDLLKEVTEAVAEYRRLTA